MKMHSLKITSTDGTGANTAVSIDGMPVKILTGIELTIDASELNHAVLHLVTPALEYDGETEITLHPEESELLVRLGWTPPEGTK